MVEENELWQLMHSNPGNFLAFLFQLGQFLDRRTFLPDRLMTNQTFLRIGDMHRFAGFRNLVAMVTFHPAARMNSRPEWDLLDSRRRRCGTCRGFRCGPAGHSPC